MSTTLHGCPKLRAFFPPQRVVQFWQKGGNRMANQMAITGCDQVGRRLVGQLNQTLIIDNHNRRRTRFDQNTKSFLCLKAEPTIPDQLEDKQTAADERR